MQQFKKQHNNIISGRNLSRNYNYGLTNVKAYWSENMKTIIAIVDYGDNSHSSRYLYK